MHIVQVKIRLLCDYHPFYLRRALKNKLIFNYKCTLLLFCKFKKETNQKERVQIDIKI